jgi:hypothetical protein
MIGIAVFVHCNQLPFDQSLVGFLERRFFDAGVLNDFLVSGPAVSFAAGATYEIRIQFELRGIQRHMDILLLLLQVHFTTRQKSLFTEKA